MNEDIDWQSAFFRFLQLTACFFGGLRIGLTSNTQKRTFYTAMVLTHCSYNLYQRNDNLYEAACVLSGAGIGFFASQAYMASGMQGNITDTCSVADNIYTDEHEFTL